MSGISNSDPADNLVNLPDAVCYAIIANSLLTVFYVTTRHNVYYVMSSCGFGRTH